MTTVLVEKLAYAHWVFGYILLVVAEGVAVRVLPGPWDFWAGLAFVVAGVAGGVVCAVAGVRALRQHPAPEPEQETETTPEPEPAPEVQACPEVSIDPELLAAARDLIAQIDATTELWVKASPGQRVELLRPLYLGADRLGLALDRVDTTTTPLVMVASQ